MSQQIIRKVKSIDQFAPFLGFNINSNNKNKTMLGGIVFIICCISMCTFLAL